MNFTHVALVAVAATVSLSHCQRALADSYYSEGLYGWYEGGPAVVEDVKIRDYFGGSLSDGKIEFDTGFHFGLGIGREITDYFRVELESGFNYNAVHRILGEESSAKLYRVPVFANLVLQYPNRTRITPVIGAGVGAHWMTIDINQILPVDAIYVDDSDSTWVFGYQGYGGLRYHFNERMNLGVFYHYSVADSPSWRFDSIPRNFSLESVRSHTLSLTFGWYF